MSVWTGEVDCDGIVYGVLIDSVTMRPIALPLFRSGCSMAERFLRYARAAGVEDIRQLDATALDKLYEYWRQDTEGAAHARDEEED